MISDKNFSNILSSHAALTPDKIYCKKINGRSVTFAELDEFVNQCCFFLQSQNIGYGDTLTINIHNSISSIILYIAAIRSGIKINPSPSTLSESELIKHVKYIKSNMVISSLDLKDNHLNYNFSYVKFIDDNKFINEISSFCTDQFEQNININDVACIYYSSGTTGSAKYVLYSHKNMVSLTESLVQTFHFTSNTKHLGVLPLGHTAIINYQFLPTLYIGGTLYLAENFNQIRNNVWKIISDYEIDYLQLVPTLIFAMLATKYDEADYLSNKTLSYIGCGSAPLSTESQKKFYEKFNINVANLYGLSESGPSHFDDPRLTDWQPGSIGTPLGVNDCKILDKNFVELEVGEVGQIALKGDNIFIGYYKNVEMYKKSFFENYFLTGDVGYKDETGKFYFSDREKDIIIKAGVNIVPGEIEEIIFKLPDVQSAAVVGIPDEYFGETIIAFIQKSNESLKEDEIMNILVENLQPLKIPSKIIFVESMPVGPSGKILKRKLREDLINE